MVGSCVVFGCCVVDVVSCVIMFVSRSVLTGVECGLVGVLESCMLRVVES